MLGQGGVKVRVGRRKFYRNHPCRMKLGRISCPESNCRHVPTCDWVVDVATVLADVMGYPYWADIEGLIAAGGATPCKVR